MSPLKDGIVILILVIFFFGAKKLPELSRSLGQSVKEFRGGIGEGSTENQELPPAPAQETTTTPVSEEAKVAQGDNVGGAGQQQH